MPGSDATDGWEPLLGLRHSSSSIKLAAGVGTPPGHSHASLSSAALANRIAVAIYLSLTSNALLCAVKLTAWFLSGSMAVLASTVDSVIDLLSQALISLADWSMSRKDERYPAGKARLEPLSVLACAAIMGLGALGVMRESGGKLVAGATRGELPRLDVGPLMLSVLALTTALKVPLYCYCATLQRASGAAEALAADHINDAVSNFGAIATAAVAAHWRQLWWADPAGGIVIAVAIIGRWLVIGHSAVSKVVGIGASGAMLAVLHAVADSHHPQMQAGFLRAYYAGQRLAVDCELEAAGTLTIQEAMAACRQLKDKLESLPEVETASVVVVPFGTHTPAAPHEPAEALLLPESVCKPPGMDSPADLWLAVQSARFGGLVPAAVATSPTAVSPRHYLCSAAPGGRQRQPQGGRQQMAAAADEADGGWWELEVGVTSGSCSSAASETVGGRDWAAQSSRHAQPAFPNSAQGLQGHAAALLGPQQAQHSGAAELGNSGPAERAAWRRGLRDRPERGTSSAPFACHGPDAPPSALVPNPALPGLTPAGPLIAGQGAEDGCEAAAAAESPNINRDG